MARRAITKLVSAIKSRGRDMVGRGGLVVRA